MTAGRPIKASPNDIIRLTREGLSQKRIAERLAVSVDTVRRAQRRAGISSKHAPTHAVSRDEIALMQRLRNAGASISQIVAKTGRSRSTVQLYIADSTEEGPVVLDIEPERRYRDVPAALLR